MKYTFLLISLVAVALSLGCAPGEKAAPTKVEKAEAQLNKVKTEAKEVVSAIQDYAFAQKSDFVNRMRAELNVFQEELDVLAAKADDKVRMEAVRAKWAVARKQLDEAEAANESNWDQVKAGFKASYIDLKDNVTDTRQWLSDKIQP